MREISRSCYSAYLLYVHVTFMIKHCHSVFGGLHHANMRQYVAGVCADLGAELKECDGKADYVHILIEYPPSVQLTKLVDSLEPVASRWLRNDFIDLRAAYSKPVLWSCPYLIDSYGGAPPGVAEKYIQNQRG